MRVVAIAIITALLSAGCAIQAGDPPSEGTQRPNELVGVGGGEQPGVNAHPEGLPRAGIGPSNNPQASPNPSPWNEQGNGKPQTGNTNGDQTGSGNNGGGGNEDNPNPSPWANPSDPHWGGVPGGAGKVGTGG